VEVARDTEGEVGVAVDVGLEGGRAPCGERAGERGAISLLSGYE
jgi:hypothetical protein